MSTRRHVGIATVGMIAVCAVGALAEDNGTGWVYVRMTTSAGSFVLELDGDKAPISVKNFLGYVDDGFYNGTVFHRVEKDFVVQGGGKTLDPETFMFKNKKTKAPIKNEAENGLKNDYGTLAMARTGRPDSGTSQFYINVKDNANLNHPRGGGWGYCVFGKVIDGMDTIETIHAHGSAEGSADGVVILEKAERTDTKGFEEAVAAAREKDRKANTARQTAENEKEASRKESMEQAKEFIKGRGAEPSGGVVSETGLWSLDVTTGTGESPEKSDKVEVHYTGWLTDGTKFDSSHDRGKPAEFRLSGVIAGWTEGVGGMKVGGKRYLIIPSELGYGERSVGKYIKAGATLVFEVELLKIVN